MDIPPVDISETAPDLWPCQSQLERRMRWSGARILDEEHVIEGLLKWAFAASLLTFVLVPIFKGSLAGSTVFIMIMSALFALLVFIFGSYVDGYWVADLPQGVLRRIISLASMDLQTHEIPFNEITAVHLHSWTGYTSSRRGGEHSHTYVEQNFTIQQLVVVLGDGSELPLTSRRETRMLVTGAGEALAQALELPFEIRPNTDVGQVMFFKPLGLENIVRPLGAVLFACWLALAYGVFRLL